MKKRDVGIISILILISAFSIIYINYFDISLAPKQGSYSGPQNRFPCVNNPSVITSSATICAGTYLDGIEIRGNNIKVKCLNSVFAGHSNPSRPNGLLVDGPYYNITVEDCTFISFPENGVLLKGHSTSSNPTKLSEIVLKNITSLKNVKNGLEVKENTYQIDVIEGNYNNNLAQGVHLVSDYKDPARYTINPDPYPKYFPNDVRIFNASMSNNGENGIYVDGTTYIRYLDDMENENNTIIVDGNKIENNLGNGVKNTDFFIRKGNLGWVTDGPYYISKNNIVSNSKSGIKINTERVQTGEIRCDNSRPEDNVLSISSIDIVYSNNIMNNKKNGIEITTDSYSNIASNNCYFSPVFQTYVKDAFNNLIVGNELSGIYHHLSYPFGRGIEGHFGSVTGYDLFSQNIISLNKKEGIFTDRPSSKKTTDRASGWRDSRTTWGCNDILLNNGSGARFSGYYTEDNVFEEGISPYFYDFNIIENNNGDGISTIYRNGYGLNYLYIVQSYIKNNNGVGINHNLNDSVNGSSGGIDRNDIIGSNLLAFDNSRNPVWSTNYWSDYSPTCQDNNPLDGWCDIPRPIPTSNQDVRPKARTPYGTNARGYLQPSQVGVVPKQECVSLQPPPYPSRPPRTGGGSEIGEPKEPNPIF